MELVEHYTKLGSIRNSEAALFGGEFRIVAYGGARIAYEREAENSLILVAANRSSEQYVLKKEGSWLDLMSGETFNGEIIIPTDSAKILKKT